MINQIINFDNRYEVLKLFESLTLKDIFYLHEVHKIINDFIENDMDKDVKYKINEIDSIIGDKIIALDPPNKKALMSNGIRSFYMCQSDIVKWINCGCGYTGKFQKCL